MGYFHSSGKKKEKIILRGERKNKQTNKGEGGLRMLFDVMGNKQIRKGTEGRLIQT